VRQGADKLTIFFNSRGCAKGLLSSSTVTGKHLIRPGIFFGDDSANFACSWPNQHNNHHYHQHYNNYSAN
jgi:hypothetical protein